MTWNAIFPGQQAAKPLSPATSPVRQPAFAGKSNRQTPEPDFGGNLGGFSSWEELLAHDMDPNFFESLAPQSEDRGDMFTPLSHSSPRAQAQSMPTSVYPDLDEFGHVIEPHFPTPYLFLPQERDGTGFFNNASVKSDSPPLNPFEQGSKRMKLDRDQRYPSHKAALDEPTLFDTSFLGVEDTPPSSKRKSPSRSGHSPVATVKHPIGKHIDDVTKDSLTKILQEYFKGKQDFHVADMDRYVKEKGLSISKTAQIARELSQSKTLPGFKKLEKRIGRYSFLPEE
jgi:hypothetical protein